MKKTSNLILSLLMAGILTTGCGISETQDRTNSSEEQVESITAKDKSKEVSANVKVLVAGEEVEDVELAVDNGVILLDAMKENMIIEETDGFINSINGVEQSEKDNKFWIYTANDEEATVGANEYELLDGDQVVWELTEF
ncbi:protein of unknown function [Carnobacterium alterfunditum]|uniref:Transcobalamin-like C-terminal domain-containing protein n=1 Tax=Carnobacterium alterfunditum TaxID=28230 RepID=A0A1N6F191_9LACT|nr:DUF4430 domain-containing protein [Carnobacterium alterfunditum]SIN88996.1 protein of unknown function [Carnobacterium alterfunditum]